ncbi:MAG: hypothetical protein IPI04_14680 [Ignavibacteria bacterium]|nr:hypothetical protein [Ignavibacteria bacterium]
MEEKNKSNKLFEITESLINYLRVNNFHSCILKNPPFLYNKNPNEETEYALIKNGFNVSSVSISNIIDLENFEFRKISEPKKRSIRKSLKKIQLEIITGEMSEDSFRAYYEILLKNRELKALSRLIHSKNLSISGRISETILFFSRLQ